MNLRDHVAASEAFCPLTDVELASDDISCGNLVQWHTQASSHQCAFAIMGWSNLVIILRSKLPIDKS